MELTGKQKGKLNAEASKHKVMFQVGQNGLTDNVIKNVLDYLKKYEVGRLTVLKTSPDTIDDIKLILEGLDILVVGKIGKVLSLYKENKKLKDRIRF